MYEVRYSKGAVRAIRRMPRNTAERVIAKIADLAVDPYADNGNVKALAGRGGYRLRVGDWRVLYDLDDGLRVLSVERGAPRGEVYDA